MSAVAPDCDALAGALQLARRCRLSWRPDERTRRPTDLDHEAVVVSLRARILDGKIEPGMPLPELELAAEFGVARPTVRAAIQTLCHEGLLVREPNRSAHIPVLTREEILDLFSVRIPIECLVVRAVLERGASLEPARAAIARHGGAARRRRLERGRRRRRRVPPRARRARSAHRAWSGSTPR